MTTCSTGPTWTATTLNSGFTGESAAIFNNLYIAGGSNPSTGNAVIQYSSDGITWTTVDLGNFAGYGVRRIAVGNSLILGMLNAAQHVISSDGINWTAYNHFPPVSGDQGVAFVNGYFVFRASDDWAYSTDGINWSSTYSAGSGGYMNGINAAYGGGMYVTCGSAGFGYTTDVTIPLTTVPYAPTAVIAYGNGAFVSFNRGLGATRDVYRSTDGINWTTYTLALPATGFVSYYSWLVFEQDRFLACKEDSNELAYSTDGITWTLTTGSSMFTSGGQNYMGSDSLGRYLAVNPFSTSAQIGDCQPPPPLGNFWVKLDNVKLKSVKIGFDGYVPPPVCDPDWGEVTFLLSGNGTLGSTTVIDDGPLALPFATEWGTWTYVDTETKYYPTSLIGSPTGALSTTIPAAGANKSWTWETWFYATSAALAGSGAGMSFLTDQFVNYAIMTKGSANGGNNELGLVFLFSANWMAASGPLPADAWTYLTITYEATGVAPGYGGTLRTFIDGVLVNSQVFGSAPITWEGQKVWIGPTANSFFTMNNYYFSDMRFTRGVARYTTSFTPPSTTLPQIGCP